MTTQQILKRLFEADNGTHFTPTETRLLFVLLKLHEERANEAGEFAATLREVCELYGTTKRDYIIAIRKYLSENNIIQCKTEERKKSVYTFVLGIPRETNKGDEKVASGGYKRETNETPTDEAATKPEAATGKASTTKTEAKPEAKPFAVTTPTGKVARYRTSKAADTARALCDDITRLLPDKKPEAVGRFFDFWATETDSGALYFETVKCFNVRDAFNMME